MTAQEYYDLLVATSRNGGFPAILESNDGTYRPTDISVRCGYRTKDGKRCAVGLLIPDDKYRDSLEGFPAQSMGHHYFDLPQGIDIDALRDLQQAHDSTALVRDVETNAWCMAESWDHYSFIRKLNKLRCFANVQKEDDSILREARDGGMYNLPPDTTV